MIQGLKGIEGLVSVLSPEFPEIDFVKLASSKAGPEGSETDFTQEQERIRKIWLRARATEICFSLASPSSAVGRNFVND